MYPRRIISFLFLVLLDKNAIIERLHSSVPSSFPRSISLFPHRRSGIKKNNNMIFLYFVEKRSAVMNCRRVSIHTPAAGEKWFMVRTLHKHGWSKMKIIPFDFCKWIELKYREQLQQLPKRKTDITSQGNTMGSLDITLLLGMASLEKS